MIKPENIKAVLCKAGYQEYQTGGVMGFAVAQHGPTVIVWPMSQEDITTEESTRLLQEYQYALASAGVHVSYKPPCPLPYQPTRLGIGSLTVCRFVGRKVIDE